MDEVRIVVVDDSADAAEMMAALLTTSGYAVRVAHDGEQALSLVEQFDPHCVLLDIKMPGLDGNELSRRLRERLADDIILIAVTGAAMGDRSVEETFARVDHYLVKPVADATLRRLLPPLHGA